MNKYSIIYADPPWTYRDKAAAGQRGAGFKYGLMTLDEIKALPVQELAADDCALFLWATMPQLPSCLQVLEAWGFEYKTAAFVWAKTTRGSSGTGRESYVMGMGNYTRANAELCLLGMKGKLERKSAGVRSLVIARIGVHSEKPPDVGWRIVDLFGALPRIELFARAPNEGWHVWGDEVKSDVKLVDGHFQPS